MAGVNVERPEPTNVWRPHRLGSKHVSIPWSRWSAASTLIELLVVIAVIAVLGTLAVFALLRRPSKLYSVTVLPSLGGAWTWACSINDRGQVVGIAQTPGAQYHLFLWDHEQGMRDLGPASGGSYVTLGKCPAVNNAGQILAAVRDANGGCQATLLDPNGGGTYLSPVGKESTLCINNRGQVAGSSYLTTGSGAVNALGFTWDAKNGTHELEGVEYVPALNDSGLMLARIHGKSRSCVIQVDQQGQFTTCDELPIEWSPFSDINNHGDVAGVMQVQGSVAVFLWHRHEGLQRCSLMADSICDIAVNDARQVVFSVGERPLMAFGRPLQDRQTRPYLWDPQGGLISLDGQLPRHLRGKFLAMDLNNTGCILGIVVSDRGTKVQAVLLEPK